MNPQIQDFQQWQPLTDFVRERDPRVEGRFYRYTKRGGAFLRCHTGLPLRTRISFQDANGTEWLRASHRGLHMADEYTWNGCTPKVWVPLLGWVGTPDCAWNIQASGWHDALCQFHMTEHFPFTREWVDNVFNEVMILDGAPARRRQLYHGAVRRFNRFSDKNPDNVKSILL